MRDKLIRIYHELDRQRRDIVNPMACGIRKELLKSAEVIALDRNIAEVLRALAEPVGRVQPKNEWEKVHGIWLMVAMPDEGYLPGELLKIETGTQTVTDKGVVNAVLCTKIDGGGRTIVLLFDPEVPYTFLGAKNVTPGPFMM